MLWIRGLQIPWFDKSNLFIRRIANPSKLQATFKNTLHPPPLFTLTTLHPENLRDLLQRLNCTIAVPCKYYRCAL